jgi:hypothetical protein
MKFGIEVLDKNYQYKVSSNDSHRINSALLLFSAKPGSYAIRYMKTQ